MWELRPLKGKYYGTVVENTQTGDIIEVWLTVKPSKYDASIREKQNGWEPGDGFDHVETQESYETALAIRDKLNEISKTSS